MSDLVPQCADIDPPAPAQAAPDNDARAVMQQAVQFYLAAQYGVAAFGFKQAAEQFDQSVGDPAAVVLASWCRASADAAEGANYARNGDRPKAIDLLRRALVRLKQQVLPAIVTILDPEERGAVQAGVIQDLCGTQIGVSNAEMIADIANGDFSGALHTAARTFKDIGQARAEVVGAQLKPELVAQVTGVFDAMEVAIRGQQAYAMAEQAAVKRRWDDAATSFDDAKELLRQAHDQWMMSPMLNAQAPLLLSMIEFLIDPARRRCQHLQNLVEDLNQFKQEMIAVAGAVGETKVNVNAHTEVAQTVISSIEVKTTIINQFEDRTRMLLGDLRRAIESAPIDEAKRKAVLAELDKVTAPAPHQEGFFQKFKQFCADSAETVGSIAKVAGPVATAWNVLAPFFGLPILPLPV